MFVLTTSLYATEKSEKKLSVKPFSVINVVGSLKVVYEQGSTYEVRLVGDAAAFDQIRAECNGSDLNISKYGKVIGNVYVETSDSSDRRSVVVHVKAPDVSVFNMSGSGQIVVGKMKSTAVIARNVAIDMLRRRRPTSISGGEAHTSWLLQQESDNNTPESQLEWKEDEQWLHQRIEQLPPREMQVMRLRQTERRTNEQIAAILGISKDSVATMLSSARRKLFNQIKERNRT